MSTQADIPPDPHGVDREREQRLTKIFIGLIGVAFLLVLIMLGGAFALDVLIEEEPPPNPPPAWDPADPVETDLPGTHP